MNLRVSLVSVKKDQVFAEALTWKMFCNCQNETLVHKLMITFISIDFANVATLLFDSILISCKLERPPECLVSWLRMYRTQFRH